MVRSGRLQPGTKIQHAGARFRGSLPRLATTALRTPPASVGRGSTFLTPSTERPSGMSDSSSLEGRRLAKTFEKFPVRPRHQSGLSFAGQTCVSVVINPSPHRLVLTRLPVVELAYRGPCPILGAHVTRVTKAGITSVRCSEYCEIERTCRLKMADCGTLRGSAEPLSGNAPLGNTHCVMLRA
jgi:hypothetical protein